MDYSVQMEAFTVSVVEQEMHHFFGLEYRCFPNSYFDCANSRTVVVGCGPFYNVQSVLAILQVLFLLQCRGSCTYCVPLLYRDIRTEDTLSQSGDIHRRSAKRRRINPHAILQVSETRIRPMALTFCVGQPTVSI